MLVCKKPRCLVQFYCVCVSIFSLSSVVERSPLVCSHCENEMETASANSPIRDTYCFICIGEKIWPMNENDRDQTFARKPLPENRLFIHRPSFFTLSVKWTFKIHQNRFRDPGLKEVADKREYKCVGSIYLFGPVFKQEQRSCCGAIQGPPITPVFRLMFPFTSFL